MSPMRRVPSRSFLLSLTCLLAACNGLGSPVGIAGSSAPSSNPSFLPASTAPVPFGSPQFPSPKPIVPPFGGGATPTPSATPDTSATATTSPTPVPSGAANGLVTPPKASTTPSQFDVPTLGEMVTTYYKNSGTDQNGNAVTFRNPDSLTVDGSGNRYVTDTGNNALRLVVEVKDDTGVHFVLETIATALIEKGTDNKPIPLNQPHGIAQITAGPNAGGMILVDSGNQAVRLGMPPAVSGVTGALDFKNLAGGGSAGYADLVGPDAQFNNPYGVAVDSSGNAYVTDTNNHCIRKITPARVVTTLAGNGTAGNAEGVGKNARFNSPKGIAIDTANTLYVVDAGNNLIRKVTPDGIVTTLAGSGTAGFKNAKGFAAQFNQPLGIAVDAFGTCYVSETGSQEVRRIDKDGNVTTLAGQDDGQTGLVDGPGITTRFNTPVGVAVDPQGVIYLNDAGNNLIRNIQPVHVVTTFSGKGRPQSQPSATIKNNPSLFPGWDPLTGNFTPLNCCNGSTTAGLVDGDSQTAQFNEPWAVVADDDLNLYVADAGNNAIRKVAPDGTVTTLAGGGAAGSADGRGSGAQFNTPRALVLDGANNLIVADAGNNAIRKVAQDGTVTTIAGGSHAAGNKDGGVDVATFNTPSGLVLDPLGNIYVADRANNVIRRISNSGLVTTVAGTGAPGYLDSTDPKTAKFTNPGSMAIDGKGNLYISDYGNSAIRVIKADSGAVGTLAGSGASSGGTAIPGWADSSGTQALFNDPWGICVNSAGLVYVADYGNSLIRQIDGQGSTTTFAGLLIGYPASTSGPPSSGYVDGQGLGAAFAAPAGICLDRKGFLYVADSKNHRIRKIW